MCICPIAQRRTSAHVESCHLNPHDSEYVSASTGDSSYAIAFLFAGQRDAAAAQLAFAFDHMLGDFNIWTETNPRVAAHNGTGNLNFLTGAGGFLENIVFGYGSLL